MKHLTYGGSTATRTINCPGWVKASEGITRRPAGVAALLGSLYHEVLEVCLRDGKTPEDMLGFVYTENGKTLVFSEDHIVTTEIMLNAANDLLDKYDVDTLMVEPFVELVPDHAGGSIDVLGLSDDGAVLLFADYKSGSKKVSPVECEQLALYAISARKDERTSDLFAKVEKVVFAIIQPSAKGVVTVWACDMAYLDTFQEAFVAAMEDDTLCAGNHCKWCPAEPYCKTKRQAVFSATLLDTNSHNELCAAADEVARVESWVKAVHEELYMQIRRGVSVPGWKVVDKRAQRKWTFPNVLGEALHGVDLEEDQFNSFFKTAPATPAQAEKLIKKYEIDIDLKDFIVKVSSGTTLATEDDSRDAVVTTDIAANLDALMADKENKELKLKK